MRELLIATRSIGKIPDMRAGLNDIPFQLITLNDTDVPADYTVEEPGNAYEAHAALKAVLYGKKANKLTLADDSGVEIDALGGWPGVHSATWLPGSDVDRLNGVLEKMKDIPDGERGAQYRAIIAIFDPVTEKLRFAEGICRGRILREQKGNGGFGYDPIFFSDDLQKTFGEATLEERAKANHRAKALEKARALLLSEFV